jgi:hypothetical protein
MNNSHESLAHSMAVVAVEVDLVKDGGGRVEWQPLDREGARRIGEAIAPDLARLLPGVEALGLTLAGALYDQTQLLAPGWPVFDELAELYLESLGGTPFKPRLLSFGCADGAMPRSENGGMPGRPGHRISRDRVGLAGNLRAAGGARPLHDDQ